MFFAIVYLLCMMQYSGSVFVQLGYWLIETYLLEHFDEYATSSAERIGRQLLSYTE